MKWQQKMGGDGDGYQEDVLMEEEIVNFFEEMDNDGSGLLDRDEVKQLLVKLGKSRAICLLLVIVGPILTVCVIVGRMVDDEELSSIMHEMDRDDSGEVDLSEFLTWWGKAGATARVEMTRVADKMNQLREVFDSLDDDKGGTLDHTELTTMITKHLGMKLKSQFTGNPPLLVILRSIKRRNVMGIFSDRLPVPAIILGAIKRDGMEIFY